jgi:hypothetical protein
MDTPHKIVDGKAVMLTSEEITEMEAMKESTALAKAADYKLHRSMAYPSIAEQLDQIYHEGIDAWKETIAAVKAEYPKP